MFGWEVRQQDEHALHITGWEMLSSLFWGAVAFGIGIFVFFQSHSWLSLGLTVLLVPLVCVGFRFDVLLSSKGILYRERFLWFPWKRRLLPLNADCQIVGLGDWGDEEYGVQSTLVVSLEVDDPFVNSGPYETEYGFGPSRGAEELVRVVQEGLEYFRAKAEESEQRELQRGYQRPWVVWMRRLSRSFRWLGLRHSSKTLYARWSVWNPTFLDWVGCVTVAVLLVLLPASWGLRAVGFALVLAHLLLARQNIVLETRRLRCWSSRWGIRFRKMNFGEDFNCRLDRDWEWPHGKEVVVSNGIVLAFEFETLGTPWVADDLYHGLEEHRRHQHRDSRQAKGK